MMVRVVQSKRKFRSTQDQSLDLILADHLVHNLQKVLPRFSNKFARNQLVQVLVPEASSDVSAWHWRNRGPGLSERRVLASILRLRLGCRRTFDRTPGVDVI
jgi:hypothetical protein